ncbi:MAG TPA: PepSY-associated TM helix domain-containing protein [Pirellulaceae bacterium]|nr:PepSY-associated TM helix domain-containing protein [Pirellulaceae bacterium]HMO92404.1 PepSY-associated TM helix domain-containing protein [Pirellulaceae bacterium]HMP69523.1 PepSY-associated TM helix domain-containing protein [Pirellulaceae bacterium]
MKLNIKLWSRRIHRWGAIICALPLLLVIVSGILLQVKKQVPWVQPPTMRGTTKIPDIDLERILQISRSVPEANINEWRDIDRLDVRPSRGLVKVQSTSNWELQIDLNQHAEQSILLSAYRRSDLIEAFHDGSIFGEWSKLLIFLPNGLILLGLWLTGVYLWYLPYQSRAKKRKRLKS